jgi:hypothetical protein
MILLLIQSIRKIRQNMNLFRNKKLNHGEAGFVGIVRRLRKAQLQRVCWCWLLGLDIGLEEDQALVQTLLRQVMRLSKVQVLW